MNHPNTKPAPANFARNLVQPSAHERGFYKGRGNPNYGKGIRKRRDEFPDDFEPDFVYGEKDSGEKEVRE